MAARSFASLGQMQYPVDQLRGISWLDDNATLVFFNHAGNLPLSLAQMAIIGFAQRRQSRKICSARMRPSTSEPELKSMVPSGGGKLENFRTDSSPVAHELKITPRPRFLMRSASPLIRWPGCRCTKRRSVCYPSAVLAAPELCRPVMRPSEISRIANDELVFELPLATQRIGPTDRRGVNGVVRGPVGAPE